MRETLAARFRHEVSTSCYLEYIKKCFALDEIIKLIHVLRPIRKKKKKKRNPHPQKKKSTPTKKEIHTHKKRNRVVMYTRASVVQTRSNSFYFDDQRKLSPRDLLEGNDALLFR